MSLWKVVIADDEALIREGIRGSIPWDQMHMTVVGEAEDGEEALELALTWEADLMLVDLNMPIMDGLTLIRELRAKRPECRIIIVTGHEEFAYAQEALRLNVDDYVLKPIRIDQLTYVITEAKKQLEQQTAQQKYFELANRQIFKNISLLRERFCLEWIEGELNAVQINEQLQFLQPPNSAPRLIGVIRWPEVSRGRPVLPENDRRLVLIRHREHSRRVFGRHAACHLPRQDRPDRRLDLGFRRGGNARPAGAIDSQIFENFDPAAFRRSERADRRTCRVPGSQARRVSGYANFPLVRRGKLFVQEHYADPDVTLEQAAERLQVSPVYFGRVFKQELGVSFGQHLTQTRIKRAIQLLTSTDLSILEIAERVGYHSQHYFSTSFRKTTGMSPIQYRKGGSAEDQEAE
ncbi:response regulator [Paenibacillus sp. P25]|nr:response regulator [Paenibacillus sp. P25]